MGRMMLAIACVPFAAALALLSLPWILLSVGYGFLGDDELADAALEASPLWRWFDRVSDHVRV